jgi:hypothetical protein
MRVVRHVRQTVNHPGPEKDQPPDHSATPKVGRRWQRLTWDIYEPDFVETDRTNLDLRNDERQSWTTGATVPAAGEVLWSGSQGETGGQCVAQACSDAFEHFSAADGTHHGFLLSNGSYTQAD